MALQSGPPLGSAAAAVPPVALAGAVGPQELTPLQVCWLKAELGNGLLMAERSYESVKDEIIGAWHKRKLVDAINVFYDTHLPGTPMPRDKAERVHLLLDFVKKQV